MLYLYKSTIQPCVELIRGCVGTAVAMGLYALHKKVKFSFKDFFSKCDQIRSFVRVGSRLLKKSLMKNFIFCTMKTVDPTFANSWTLDSFSKCGWGLIVISMQTVCPHSVWPRHFQAFIQAVLLMSVFEQRFTFRIFYFMKNDDEIIDNAGGSFKVL